MSGLTPREIMVIVNRWIGVSSGYLGDFSYRTHAEFYPEYCDLSYNPDDLVGTTRERFIEILKSAPPDHQARIVEGVLERFPIDGADAPPTRTAKLRAQLCDAITRIRRGGGVLHPSPEVTSDVVRRTLADAETLVERAEAGHAVDRVHTALHGYLQALCTAAEIEPEPDASVTHLLKALRQEHATLRAKGPRAPDIDSMLKGMSSIIDKLQPVRNRASLAHPNPILPEPEANLVINAVRTVFHYLDQKLRA
jgi:hypothetical protein